MPLNEYVLFTSDHEEIPKMLLDYIEKLPPQYPYYRIRLIRLVDGRLEPLFDPTYQPNLCSNRMRFTGWPEAPFPSRPAGRIDIPMIHNKSAKDMHSYSSKQLPVSYRRRYLHVGVRLLRLYKEIMSEELGRGLFRKGDDRLY